MEKCIAFLSIFYPFRSNNIHASFVICIVPSHSSISLRVVATSRNFLHSRDSIVREDIRTRGKFRLHINVQPFSFHLVLFILLGMYNISLHYYYQIMWSNISTPGVSYPHVTRKKLLSHTTGVRAYTRILLWRTLSSAIQCPHELYKVKLEELVPEKRTRGSSHFRHFALLPPLSESQNFLIQIFLKYATRSPENLI